MRQMFGLDDDLDTMMLLRWLMGHQSDVLCGVKDQDREELRELHQDETGGPPNVRDGDMGQLRVIKARRKAPPQGAVCHMITASGLISSLLPSIVVLEEAKDQ